MADTAPPSEALPDSDEAPESPDRFRAVFQIAGSVVAPTTLLTAVLIYFGRNHAYWFFQYFGVDISLLGFSTQDYVRRSVDALLVPMVVLSSVGLLLVWAHVAWSPRLFTGPGSRQRLARAARILAVAGFVFFGIGLAGLLVPYLKRAYHLVYPISLGTGTLLLVYASSLQRRARGDGRAIRSLRTAALLEAAAAFVLVGLSLFWASTNYAADVGTDRAQQYAAQLEALPAATLYSKERLNLDAPSVQEVVCSEPDAGYCFRYEGLRLMLRSGGNYFFLPECWTHATGVAMVVPESEGVRLDFSRADRPERRDC